MAHFNLPTLAAPFLIVRVPTFGPTSIQSDPLSSMEWRFRGNRAGAHIRRPRLDEFKFYASTYRKANEGEAILNFDDIAILPRFALEVAQRVTCERALSGKELRFFEKLCGSRDICSPFLDTTPDGDYTFLAIAVSEELGGLASESKELMNNDEVERGDDAYPPRQSASVGSLYTAPRGQNNRKKDNYQTTENGQRSQD
ncbi:hypothetical protein FN846DRAFT_1014291 [Sphaerosporella brunnea]|uniref:Uncharacterized protein n=1 Tax=Sphaerosporella brunnea TaxID=1250544 RepID=A0A5J5EXW3_9PEZI|nr:hypothetical protein FN846DRAFT_1014291 [Sphaerosporella brunnea]